MNLSFILNFKQHKNVNNANFVYFEKPPVVHAKNHVDHRKQTMHWSEKWINRFSVSIKINDRLRLT